jgi:hypothetical protein
MVKPMRIAGRLALVALPFALPAQKFYTYVGDAGANHAVIAWGTTEGRNTIGRSSPSHGKAVVKIAGRELTEEKRNWVTATGLQPDTEYAYEVLIGGRPIGAAKLRTWPAKTDRLTFFVIGDFGNGSRAQYRVAEAMWKEFEKSRDPVRFVLTTGDNIYAHKILRFGSGDEDDEWDSRFFRPYEPLLARIPFYPTLGNHDGNESESRADLAAYLDNFFFPRARPARYYHFSYADLAEFFALDTSLNTMEGRPASGYGPDGAQIRWLAGQLGAAAAPWKIAFFHHPPFGAGPRHEPSLGGLSHIVGMLAGKGVRVAFNGHEHNFQFSEQNASTQGIRFIVTGAGGELRGGDVRKNMARTHIEGWAPQHHFLRVEIQARRMRIWPLSWKPVAVLNRDGNRLAMPIEVTVP